VLCEDLPEGVPLAPKSQSWGLLFGGKDCVAGYAGPTWDLFNELYREARVTTKRSKSTSGIDTSIIAKLAAEGYAEKYKSNKWIGRLGL
jgi:NitT/TauT family transport system substrate-binding protein